MSALPSPCIRIILPVYRDRHALSRTLPRLLRHWAPDELLVVDAGDDGAANLAASEGVRALRASPERTGRAKQMNDGARAVPEADLLLFLHADTLLPAAARERLIQAHRDGIAGGAFARRFDPPSPLLHCTSRLADLRGHTLGWFFGDQAIFARREIFECIGGFPERSLFEDLAFSRRLKHAGKVRLLRPQQRPTVRRRGRLQTHLAGCQTHLPLSAGGGVIPPAPPSPSAKPIRPFGE